MYNFVLFGSDWDLYKQSYADLKNDKNVLYVTPKSLFGWKFWLFKLHFSVKINLLFQLPLKKIWLKVFDNILFSNKNPICFIFFSSWNALNNEIHIVDYLRAKYPDSKYVVFFQDIFATQRNLYSQRPIDALWVKSQYDLVLSYDYGDAEKMGFIYHSTVLSYTEIGNHNEIPESDVYFIGQAKDRLSLIVQVFKQLTILGLKCEFMILGVPKSRQLLKDQIHYIDKPLSYKENLKYMSKAKCLLDILQDGACGYTFRTLEAIVFDKKILTNNITIQDAPFYNEDDVILFRSIEEIDQDVKLKINNGAVVDYQYKETISPKKLLEFIEDRL